MPHIRLPAWSTMESTLLTFYVRLLSFLNKLFSTCFMNSVLQGLFATDLLRQMVEYQPQDDNRSFVNLPPHRSPLLTNGRGPKDVQQEWCEGLPVGDTFIRILERAWMMRDKKDRASMSPKCVPLFQPSCIPKFIPLRELLARLGKKYDQYLDVCPYFAYIRFTPFSKLLYLLSSANKMPTNFSSTSLIACEWKNLMYVFKKHAVAFIPEPFFRSLKKGNHLHPRPQTDSVLIQSHLRYPLNPIN